MRSPVPVHIASPSESCTSGRQSMAVGFSVSENQYIEVSGAMPSARRRGAGTAASMSIITPLSAPHQEPVGAGDARALEQRVDA